MRAGLRLAAGLLAAVALAAPTAAQDLATLRATAEADGRVRVLVELATPTRPEARLGTASLRAQRARIAAAQAAVLTTAGPDARPTRRYAALPLLGLEVGPAALDALARDALARDGGVARVFPDRRNYPTLGATVPRVGAPDAWALGFDGAGTTVAVLDTGVDADHPTFDGTTVREACFSTHAPESGVTSLCEDFATEAVGPGAAAPTPDLAGAFHGTHVASTAVGGGGGPVAAGVAPAADLAAIEVFTRGEACWGEGTADCTFALDSDVLAGLEHALEHQAAWNLAAVNLSLGTTTTYAGTCASPYDGVFRDLRAAGVGVIVASGNGRADGGISSPACAADAIAVGATEIAGGAGAR
ncbi:MAG: S8 family serine peptidase, partial [Trueperaceae bacterium]|nr:S8 family serine peptidase [Trueperaceae bacterium]